MKGLMREVLTIWGGLIVLFLLLTHFTGFEREIKALGSVGVDFTRQLQGVTSADNPNAHVLLGG